MDGYGSILLSGTVFSVVGVGSVLWRFFHQRSGRTSTALWNEPPRYVWGWIIVAIGVIAIAWGMVEVLVRGLPVPPMLWIGVGLAVGAVIAAPGVMITVSNFTEIAAWAASPSEVRQPLAAPLGTLLVGAGIAVAIGLPTALLILRG